MRGFTTLADRLPPETIFDLLNRYFDTQVPAIIAHGGAVLKFMGDGLLAIFPISGNDATAVCHRALSAARQTRANITELAPPPDCAPVRFGLALHIGQVLYGNIGSGDRLDFTCIGPAVNLTARLETLAGKLGRPIVTSGDFAQHCPDELARLGEFTLPGFAAPQQVFAPIR
jgi:adenylate cyclase